MGHYRSDVLAKAWQEIYMAEGSDWFWWYGEPHNSGQDDVFDAQFRCHLANVYRLLDQPVPDYLNIPLTITMGHPLVMPTAAIKPPITGNIKDTAGWQDAGRMEIRHGAMHRSSQILQKLLFGSDAQHLYLRLDFNLTAITPYHEVFLYICIPGKTRHNSPIRLKGTTGQTVATQRYHYAYEIQIQSLHSPQQTRFSVAEALPDHLWMDRPDLLLTMAFQDVLDLGIPFDALDLSPGGYLQMAVAVAQGGIMNIIQPHHFLLAIDRLVEPILSLKGAQNSLPMR
jgi:alpha-amylase/alpha-mannosidase (GH57 family)